jgi:hypothetical protein
MEIDLALLAGGLGPEHAVKPGGLDANVRSLAAGEWEKILGIEGISMSPQCPNAQCLKFGVSTNPVLLLSSIASTVSDSFLRLNEKDICRLFLLQDFATVGINEGNITGLLIPPHQIPDRRLKPVSVPKRKR